VAQSSGKIHLHRTRIRTLVAYSGNDMQVIGEGFEMRQAPE